MVNTDISHIIIFHTVNTDISRILIFHTVNTDISRIIFCHTVNTDISHIIVCHTVKYSYVSHYCLSYSKRHIFQNIVFHTVKYRNISRYCMSIVNVLSSFVRHRVKYNCILHMSSHIACHAVK
jgi:hypothetical protein